MFDLTIIEASARRLGEPYSIASSRVLDRFGIRAFLNEAVPPNPWWEGLSDEELGDRVVDELGRPGFSDAGRTRTIAWRALGVEWRVLVANDYQSVLAAERLAAVLQVAAAELSRHELLIAPTQIRIQVTTREEHDPRRRAVFQPSNDGREWEVSLLTPEAAGTGEQAFADAIVVLLDVLGDISLLNPEDLDRFVQSAWHEGLIERFAPMLLYDRLVPVSPARFDESNRYKASPMCPGDGWPREHRDLRWSDSLGPGYTRAEGEDRVRSRYEAMRRLMPHSIPLLILDAGVRQVCEELGAQGWKDWHLLQALTSMVMSFRLSSLPTRDLDALEEAGRRMAQVPETPGDPTPPAADIDADAMKAALRGSMLVTVRTWGLSLRQTTPDFPAIEKFLATRYRFWDDDVPHDRWWEDATLM